MSMNSFSFKANSRSQRRTLEDTLTEPTLLDLNPDEKLLPGDGAAHKASMTFHQPVDLQKLQKDYSSTKGRRGADRHDVQLTVLVANHTKQFRTQSKNISLTGLLVEDLLPSDFSGNWIEIVLIQTEDSGKKNFLYLRGKTIISHQRTRRIQFDASFKNPKNTLSKFLEPLIP